jgi:hypothetical protein
MSHAKPVITAMAAVVIAFPMCVSANTISGGIHFSGDVTVSTNTVTGVGMLSFNPLPNPNSAFTFTVDNGSGFFAGLGGFGDEMDFTSATAPIDTPLDIGNVVTFQDTPDTFTMTEVYGGVDGTAGCSDVLAHAASGNVCSPFGTPYNLQDIAPNGQNSSATFVVTGFLMDGGTPNPATITFTAASTGKSYEQILHDQENGVADVITYGAQLQTIGPEPGTPSLMLGACLLLAGGMLRRKKTH